MAIYQNYDDLEDYAIALHDAARMVEKELNNEFGKEVLAIADKLIKIVKEEKYGKIDVC